MACIAGDADGMPGGLSFGEGRVVRRGFRAKLLQFRLLRVRRGAQSVVKTVSLNLLISLRFM
jgi:hypothetical protein